jgi:hypothetical protein
MKELLEQIDTTTYSTLPTLDHDTRITFNFYQTQYLTICLS